MREAPRLPRAAVNGDAHVDHVADLAEELVEFAVRHVEGHVADEEGAGRGGGGLVAVALDGGVAGLGVLDGEAAAGEGLVVIVADGGGGGFGVGEVHVAEPAGGMAVRWIGCIISSTRLRLLSPRKGIEKCGQ